MLDYKTDGIELDEENEKMQEQLALEWIAEIELAIEQDKHPLEPETDELPEKKKLKREMKAEALNRLESSARTKADFDNVISWWDKQDANRERRERYHELSRSGDRFAPRLRCRRKWPLLSGSSERSADAADTKR